MVERRRLHLRFHDVMQKDNRERREKTKSKDKNLEVVGMAHYCLSFHSKMFS